MTIEDRAKQAQDHWNCVGTPRLIGHRENAVFQTYTKDGTALALRLHRNGYQTYSHIEGEMIWTERLAENGFPCSSPVRTHQDALIVCFPDGQMATAVAWIDAPPIANTVRSAAENRLLYHDLGQLLARLHKTTDTFDIKINRPAWDADALLGDTPNWGQFWKNSSLTREEIDTTLAARNDAMAHLSSLPSPDMGLIHADAIIENVLQDTQLHLIDFDDSGYGYRLYDLGVALIQHESSPELPNLIDAICDGYAISTDHIRLFMMLRAMASAGWIISRAPDGDPKHRHYAERMLRQIQAYAKS